MLLEFTGHLGTPFGCAPLANALWGKIMRPSVAVTAVGTGSKTRVKIQNNNTRSEDAREHSEPRGTYMVCGVRDAH